MNPYHNPFLEKVTPEFGNSFVIRGFSETKPGFRPNWHYHPEMELVFIEEGWGKKLIGNHVSYFTDGDLILIGSNLPHYGFPSRLTGENQEIVVQIHESCFGVGFLDMVETSSIKELFERSKQGLSFYGNTKTDVGERLKSMFHMTSFEKMIELIKIFHIMSLSEEYEILNASGQTIIVKGNDNNRIDTIYEFVRQNFESKISLDEIANTVNMTVPALCRFFKKSTGKTFIQFVTEYRIAYACKLISEDYYNISSVAYDCGFNNLSNFNRSFKKITGKSPSQYRKEIKKVLTSE
jgi:AraC-like DNA-binding protein